MFRACELKDQTYKKTRTLQFSESLGLLWGLRAVSCSPCYCHCASSDHSHSHAFSPKASRSPSTRRHPIAFHASREEEKKAHKHRRFALVWRCGNHPHPHKMRKLRPELRPRRIWIARIQKYCKSLFSCFLGFLAFFLLRFFGQGNPENPR